METTYLTPGLADEGLDRWAGGSKGQADILGHSRVDMFVLNRLNVTRTEGVEYLKRLLPRLAARPGVAEYDSA